MEFNSDKAIYLQIADYICDQIQMKKWKSNEKIPSVRELAVILEVNPNTVMRAYDHLQQQEIIYTKRGMGYFVNEHSSAKILKERKDQFLKEELPAIFRRMQMLGINSNELLSQLDYFNKTNV